MPRNLEHLDHRALVARLELCAAPGCLWFHIPNPRSKVAGANLKLLGMMAGLPDLILIHQGRVFGLELKTPRGRVSPVQRACHARLIAAGAVIATVVGVDAAVAQLHQWGLLR
jgi:hypothetical protein